MAAVGRCRLHSLACCGGCLLVSTPTRPDTRLVCHEYSRKGAAKRNEVDLKRADLERIQHEMDLFGPNPSDQAAKNRAVYFLLRVCLELERI